MIICDHTVTEKTGDTSQGIPQNRGTDVAHVHRLRDVRRTEIDHDRLRIGGECYTQAVVQSHLPETLSDKFAAQAKVDEPRTCNLRLRTDIFEGDSLDDLGGKCPRILVYRFGENHCQIGLVIAMAPVGGRNDLRTVRWQSGRLERLNQPLLESIDNRSHSPGTLARKSEVARLCYRRCLESGLPILLFQAVRVRSCRSRISRSLPKSGDGLETGPWGQRTGQ